MNGVSQRIGDASDIVYSYPFQSQTGHRLYERRYTLSVFLCPNRISYIVVTISDNTPPYQVIIYYDVPISFHATCPIEIENNLKIFYVSAVFSHLFLDLLNLLTSLNQHFNSKHISALDIAFPSARLVLYSEI